jgi:NAD(P)H-quinone oxidoreductase subunit 5
MESYSLILLALYPIIIKTLAIPFPRLKFSSLIFLGPFLFVSLTTYSFLIGAPIELSVWNFSSYLSLGLKLDILSGLIASTVLTIGMVVMRFSVRYLEDDPEKAQFLKNLSYTLSSVLTMIMSSNLVLFFISWMGTSYFLHQLLIHFPERSGAQKAANQKFWISRLGDIFIISSGSILFWTFNTLEFESIFIMVKNPDFVLQNNLSINIASIFLVLGAMTKSAQFPFHYWLPNTMETPTPVSAIMHAGVINAGGYLVIRMSPLLSQTSVSLSLLALIGGLTAFYGSLVMFTQTNVKKQLAYSTISQMGFMMLQCGLGAFSIAVVHIIGHAFYKAYAFLSSGTATDFGRLNRYYPRTETAKNVWAPIMIGVLSLALVFGPLIAVGYEFLERSGVSVLLVILSLAIAQIFLGTRDRTRSILVASCIFGLYITLSIGMTFLLGEIIPTKITMSAFGLITVLVSLAIFIALFLVQNNLERISKTRIGKEIYVRAL